MRLIHIKEKYRLSWSAIALLTVIAGYAYDIRTVDERNVELYFNILNDNEVELTYESKFKPTPTYKGSFEVPSTINFDGHEYTVISIGDFALFGSRELTEINLPECITTIGKGAFAWCDAINEITIPASTVYIGSNAFDGCYSLNQIKVSKAGGKYAEYQNSLYTSDLKTIVAYTPGVLGDFELPATVETIDDDAFASCAFLTGITLPDGITFIGSDAFYFCNSLTHIEIPSTVETIQPGAFNDCANLLAINVDEGNTKYASDNGVLLDNSKTHLIQSPAGYAGLANTPGGITNIHDGAFMHNAYITTVKLPETTTHIGNTAFIDCERVNTIELPSTITSIGEMAFAQCPALTAIYCRAENPKEIKLGAETFVNTPESATLYVPSNSIKQYIKAPQWRRFKNIRAIDDLLEQSIVWDQPSDSLAVGSEFELNATATSGLPVAYMLSPESIGNGTLSDNTLTVLTDGPIKVIATQKGNSQYLPATPKVLTFNIPTGITDPTVSASNAKVYGTFGKIVIKDANPQAICRVFDMNGIERYQGLDREITAAPGLYIVTVENTAHKVIVR